MKKKGITGSKRQIEVNTVASKKARKKFKRTKKMNIWSNLVKEKTQIPISTRYWQLLLRCRLLVVAVRGAAARFGDSKHSIGQQCLRNDWTGSLFYTFIDKFLWISTWPWTNSLTQNQGECSSTIMNNQIHDQPCLDPFSALNIQLINKLVVGNLLLFCTSLW